MPSVTHLIDLRDRAELAQRGAETAKANERSAARALARGRQSYDAAIQREADARQKLNLIQDAIAQIQVVKAELQALESSLTEITTSLTELDAKILAVEAEIETYRQAGSGKVPDQLLIDLEQLRGEQKAIQQAHEDTVAAQTTALDRLAQLQIQAAQLDKTQQVVDETEREVTRHRKELAQLERTLNAAEAEMVTTLATAQALAAELQLALDQLITGLKPDIPIALLPIRLETRFRIAVPDQPDELWIRVYPDDLHQGNA